MLFDLMHKDTRLAQVSMDFGYITTAELDINLQNKDLLPVGTCIDGVLVIEELQKWWNRRRLHLSKSKMKLLKQVGLSPLNFLILQSFGASLTDSYWINSDAMPFDPAWVDIDFRKNPSNDDIGELLLTGASCKNITHLLPRSPSLTLRGSHSFWHFDSATCSYKLRTSIDHGRDKLIISFICKSLDFPCVGYSLADEFIECDNICDADTELIDYPVNPDYDLPLFIEQHEQVSILSFIIGNKSLYGNNYIRDADGNINTAPIHGGYITTGITTLQRPNIAKYSEIRGRIAEHELYNQLTMLYQYETAAKMTEVLSHRLDALGLLA